jgi:hypothetical protein
MERELFGGCCEVARHRDRWRNSADEDMRVLCVTSGLNVVLSATTWEIQKPMELESVGHCIICCYGDGFYLSVQM